MKNAEISSMAASLYDGGWRAEDRAELIEEYQLSEHVVDQIIECFEEYSKREKEEKG